MIHEGLLPRIFFDEKKGRLQVMRRFAPSLEKLKATPSVVSHPYMEGLRMPNILEKH